MNNNAKAWIEALKSGEYEQGKYILHGKYDVDGNMKDMFCCLGVACKLYIDAGNTLEVKEDALYGAENTKKQCFSYEGEKCVLPVKVKIWLDLSTEQGMANNSSELDLQNTLVRMNDEGISFKEIAEFIEGNPTGLFLI